MTDEGVTKQVDQYYDTSDRLLYKNNYTLRIRQKNGKYCVTFKSPSDSVSDGEGGQLERNEIEREVNSSNLKDCSEMVQEYFGSFLSQNKSEFNDLDNNIDIINSRKKMIVVKNLKNEYVKEEKYEIVFDDVEYVNKDNGRKYKELQIEIELKSSVETRINMKGLTDDLEKEIKELKSIIDSKYHRAVEFIG